MSGMTARELLAMADRHRRTVSAAEWARTKIRLGDTPIMRRGVLGFRKENTYRECEFTAEETQAIYEALSIVERDNRSAANDLERRVTTTTKETR